MKIQIGLLLANQINIPLPRALKLESRFGFHDPTKLSLFKGILHHKPEIIAEVHILLQWAHSQFPNFVQTF
jgi:hypothetical protein